VLNLNDENDTGAGFAGLRDSRNRQLKLAVCWEGAHFDVAGLSRRDRAKTPLPHVGRKKKSPDGDCGRCRSCRAAPPVQAGPSGPVVPGPSQAATQGLSGALA
jgi:hypothetical protein